MYKVIDHLCILYIVTVYIYAWSLNLITVLFICMFVTYVYNHFSIYVHIYIPDVCLNSCVLH